VIASKVHTYTSHAKLEASVCVDSFYEFLRRFWDIIIAEEPIWNWHIEYLCDELQLISEQVFIREPKLYDLIINVSPGSTKSTIGSVMFPVWVWVREQTIRSICGSYSSPLSLHLGSLSLTIVNSDKFKMLFPHIRLKEEQKSLMTNYAGGQRISTSVGGSITGKHGHFLITDDPLDPMQALSQAKLATALNWLDQTLMSRKIDKIVTPHIMIMQRLAQNDPTGHITTKKDGSKLKHICLPAILTKDVKPRRVRKFYKKGLFDPIRMSGPVLKEVKVDLGEYAYAGQFLQNPIPIGGALFKVERLRIDIAPLRFVKIVRYWDKAGTRAGRTATAYTVGAKLGKDVRNRIWILDVVRGQWEAEEREAVIRQTADIDGKSVIIGLEQEPGSGGKESAQATIKNLLGFRVYKERPIGDKTLRADPFAVQVNNENVFMVRGEWNLPFIEELRHFPHSTTKDQVDAASAAFNNLAKKTIKIGAMGR